MIHRYSRKIMTDIWSDQTKFSIWLDIEISAHEALEKNGLIESGLTDKIIEKTRNIQFDTKRILEIEKKT